jgi:hypothetical protein
MGKLSNMLLIQAAEHMYVAVTVPTVVGTTARFITPKA